MKVTVLRAEVLAPTLYIALFAGQPGAVQIREPHVGLRFGVNVNQKTGAMTADRRDRTGAPVGTQTNPVSFRKTPLDQRTLDIAGLNAKIVGGGGSSMIALQLEQPPYVQDFVETTDEAKGSVNPNTVSAPIVISRAGKTLDLTRFKARFAEAQLRRNS